LFGHNRFDVVVGVAQAENKWVLDGRDFRIGWHVSLHLEQNSRFDGPNFWHRERGAGDVVFAIVRVEVNVVRVHNADSSECGVYWDAKLLVWKYFLKSWFSTFVVANGQLVQGGFVFETRPARQLHRELWRERSKSDPTPVTPLAPDHSPALDVQLLFSAIGFWTRSQAPPFLILQILDFHILNAADA
jgi:hypothetical protein